VETFDEAEYGRWLATAEDHLRVARHDALGGFHSAAVLQAEQAAQCALKALLHGVGQAQAARGHGLLSLAEACAEWAGLTLDQQHRDALARLARDYQPTRYPDALPEGTPMGHYGPSDSSWALAVAEQTLEATRSNWDDLLRQAGEASEDAERGDSA
jgi:HEPN domain-containing protein